MEYVAIFTRSNKCDKVVTPHEVLRLSNINISEAYLGEYLNHFVGDPTLPMVVHLALSKIISVYLRPCLFNLLASTRISTVNVTRQTRFPAWSNS